MNGLKIIIGQLGLVLLTNKKTEKGYKQTYYIVSYMYVDIYYPNVKS